ncbi:hypothetical protein F5884DRAFT_62228 [Xylogone sp. PMI_703]|nr:hypothetical protein F5884DRAFT_62228 [Xylogone sp. PMI_703]
MESTSNKASSSLSSSPDKMQSSTVQASSPSRNHYTGFPEPLSLDRNTTMRFPGADTSPNACIEDNTFPAPTQSRRLRLSSRRSKSGSHGFLPRQQNTSAITLSAMYEDGTFTESSGEGSDDGHVLKDTSDNINAAVHGRRRKTSDASGSSENGSIGSAASKGSRRRGFMGLFHHKH